MANSKPVILILGAGPNVGVETAKYFASKGWAVAAASRSPKDDIKEIASLSLAVDFSDAGALKPAFERVVAEVGTPSVVLYNAYSMNPTRKSHPLTLAPETLRVEMAVNVLAAYEAMRLAVELWGAAPKFASGGPATPVFLYTGNMMNTQLHPLGLGLGMAKNANAYALETAAAVYRGAYRFYFVDERTPELESVYQHIDGKAHALEFFSLVEGVAEKNNGIELGPGKGQGEWCWTFVKGKGYVRVKDYVGRELRVDLDVPGFE